ncbi:hypothetical protein H2248_003883 [Termitomyces sp. 'cryptogamus']|nr:hypothetical protein H2248_003883 [Termitomyces sp. 'cryptogamus']
MGRSDETILLIAHRNSPKYVIRFPLDLAPSHVRPYLELIRLEKPTGTVLMFWPFAWGLTMAAFATGLPLQLYGSHLIECFISAFLLRSSACTVNDIFDREIDAGVERTRGRPLASGRISVFAATVYLFVQYIMGISFFYVTVNDHALWVGLFQLLPLFAIYPLLKRFTHWPQAWLGFAMNFGFVTAWVSLTGRLDVKLISIAMTGCWFWTMLYGIYCLSLLASIEFDFMQTQFMLAKIFKMTSRWAFDLQPSCLDPGSDPYLFCAESALSLCSVLLDILMDKARITLFCQSVVLLLTWCGNTSLLILMYPLVVGKTLKIMVIWDGLYGAA